MPGGPSVPKDIGLRYDVHEWRNALAILRSVHPEEWSDILTVLRAFRLHRSDILAPGGRKSNIAKVLDGHFYELGWIEKKFDTRISVDDMIYESPTHGVDCFKNRVAIEVEWNNKDPFFDRDLNNFRLLFELRAVDVGVIITRGDDLEKVFRGLGKKVKAKYPRSTTQVNKLVPRVEGGGGGGCPIVVFGIGERCYVDD